MLQIKTRKGIDTTVQKPRRNDMRVRVRVRIRARVSVRVKVKEKDSRLKTKHQ